VGTKNGRLLSLMVRILVRPVLTVVIMLSLAPLAGCSGAVGDPYGQVNEHIADAKESVESGEDTAQEEERMAQARENMQKARDTLGEARGQLSEVQDLEVEAEVKEYAEILSEAIDAQLAGEGGEIGFYELLERDPTLEDNRERAKEILTEVDDRYEEARNAYDRARELADANPDLLPEG
jgi:TolA-binding protein